MTALAIRKPRDLEGKAGAAAALLGALANPRRLMILCELAQGERTVGELVRAVGVQQAALSQHLAKLRRAGVVKSRPKAQMALYRIDSPAAVAVINTLSAIFCPPSPRKSKR